MSIFSFLEHILSELFRKIDKLGQIYKQTSSQAFWLSSAPSALSTLVTSVVLYSLTRATLMSPGQDETRLCGYICSELIH